MIAKIKVKRLPDAPAPTKAVRIDDWRRTLINELDAQQAAEKGLKDKSPDDKKTRA